MREWTLAATSVVVATFALTACGPIAGHAPTHAESAVPTALESSDLDIANAEPAVTLSGFNHSLAVVVQVERDTVDAVELREMLAMIVEVTGEESDLTWLTLAAENLTSDVPLADPHRYVDLQTPAVELGFDRDEVADGMRSI